MKLRWLIMGIVVIAVYVFGFYIGRMEETAGMAGEEHAAVESADAGAHGAHEHQKDRGGKQLYQCPMHPTYISDQKGECPICGMTLVPIEEEGEMEESSVEGYAPINVSYERQQLIGVKTGIIERRPMNKVIRTVGLVDYDEKRIANIHTKVSGWIEGLYVDYTGKLVEKGEPLLTILQPGTCLDAGGISARARRPGRARGQPDRGGCHGCQDSPRCHEKETPPVGHYRRSDHGP